MHLSLSPAQLFAIRETVLSPGFIDSQNDIFESLNPENKPFFYFGNLYEPEFQILWTRNIIPAEDMPEEEKEFAIRHNMGAYLVNIFLIHLIEGKITDSVVTAETLKTFIQENDPNFLLNSQGNINNL